MPKKSHPSSFRYKETTLQQLRSFYETGRLGSLAAAAKVLELSNPTVWEQVHALERELNQTLVETNSRGTWLTPAGERLFALISPIVQQVNGIKQRFEEAIGNLPASLRVAATPRTAAEDLPFSVAAFRKQYPEVTFRLYELGERELVTALANGEIDIAFCQQDSSTPLHTVGGIEALVEFSPCYPVRPMLVTPPGHPLLTKKKLKLEDLEKYPMVNSYRETVTPPNRTRVLSDRPSTEWLQPRRTWSAELAPSLQSEVSCMFSYTIRQYVKLGFGIGLTPFAGPLEPDPGLAYRDLSELLGQNQINVFRRAGTVATDYERAFIATVRSQLGTVEDTGSSVNSSTTV